MRSRFLIPLSLILLASPPGMLAQVSAKEPPPPAAKKAEKKFDPYRAEKSVEIGRFYMKKGNYDAAIDRFEDAAHAKPNFALPYRLMGEAYEKKREKAQAVKAYEKYLEILPSAEDGGKVRKRIVQLKGEMERDAKRRK